MVKGSHLVIHTGVRGGQALPHSLIFREFYTPEFLQQCAAPFQIGGGIQVQNTEHQGPQRIELRQRRDFHACQAVPVHFYPQLPGKLLPAGKIGLIPRLWVLEGRGDRSCHHTEEFRPRHLVSPPRHSILYQRNMKPSVADSGPAGYPACDPHMAALLHPHLPEAKRPGTDPDGDGKSQTPQAPEQIPIHFPASFFYRICSSGCSSS